MNLLNLLMSSMTSDSSVSALSQKTGISTGQLTKLLTAAIPILLKFLTKNASSKEGASSLLSALTQHKETRSMAEQITGANEEDGLKIVNHILGSEAETVVSGLASDNSLQVDQVNKALANVAPGLLSGLSAATDSASKVNLSGGLDLGDLAGMFGAADMASAAKSSSSGLLGSLGSLVGSLFGGGSQEKETADDGVDGLELLGSLTSLLK